MKFEELHSSFLYSNGDDSFPNNVSPQLARWGDSIPKLLWQWAFADRAEQCRILEDLNGLSFELEYTLSGFLHESFLARSNDWWCDGVVDLEVVRSGRLTFCINGAAWNPGHLTAFQLEYHFHRRRELTPFKIIFRFGEVDHNGRLQKYPPQRTVPRSQRRWIVDQEIV